MGVSTHHKANPCDIHTHQNLHVNNVVLKRRFFDKKADFWIFYWKSTFFMRQFKTTFIALMLVPRSGDIFGAKLKLWWSVMFMFEIEKAWKYNFSLFLKKKQAKRSFFEFTKKSAKLWFFNI